MAEKKINILIRGAGFKNKGAEAMLLTTCEELTKRVKNIALSAIVPNEQEAQMCRDEGIRPVIFSRPRAYLRPFFVANALLQCPPLLPYMLKSTNLLWQLLQFNNADVIIDISGYAHGDILSLGATQKALTLVKYCGKNGKSYIFLPQTWGPFKKQSFAPYIRELCANAESIYPRDAESLDSLKSLSDFPAVSNQFVPDIAFKFHRHDLNVGRNILQKKGVPDPVGNPVIGIVPNYQIIKRLGGNEADNSYINTLADVADYCIQTLNVNVVLMPHHASLGDKEDTGDVPACFAIKSKVQNQDRCTILTDDYDAASAKSIIGCFQILVASRFHGLVASLSQGVPAIAVSWAHKYPALLGLFDLQEYSVDFSGMKSEYVLSLLEKAWKQRNENRQKILRRLPEINKKVDAMFDSVAESIKKYND